MAFNSYGNTVTEIGGSNVVWRKVNAVLQSGVDLSDECGSKKIIAAGTPVAWNTVGGKGTLLTTAELVTTNKALNIGYILNDVNLAAGDTYATASVVIDGELYVDRIGESGVVAAAKAAKAYAPKVVLINEVEIG